MKLLYPRSRVVGVAASVAAVLAAACAFAGPPLVAGMFALFAAASVVVSDAMRKREREKTAVIDDLIGAASANAETGRRLAIFERDTQLFAHWYIELRGEEECDRCERYGRELTLVVIEPTPGPQEREVQVALAGWLREHKRNTDIVGYLGNARYIVLMPETGGIHVAGFVQRLYRDVPHADLGVATFGHDGLTYTDLYGAAVARLGQQGMEDQAA